MYFFFGIRYLIALIIYSLHCPRIPQFKIDRLLVQTYIDAKSLEEHVRASITFSETEVKQIAKELLEILIYLHSRLPPIIHRDIKPSNILLTKQTDKCAHRVYLVDFGSVQTSSFVESTNNRQMKVNRNGQGKILSPQELKKLYFGGISG